jgi:inorganic phosphate transporter, PiT family
MVQQIIFFLTIGIGYIYAFVTGFSDASNSIATAIGSRALSTKQALAIASIMEFFGAITGTAVALTITSGIVKIGSISVATVLAALLGVVFWSLLTYKFGIPVSETHGLIGSIMGAGVAIGGFGVILYDKLSITLIAIFLSPLLGFLVGFAGIKVLHLFVKRGNNNMLQNVFKKLHWVSSGFIAFSHGHNDAQKPMGIIALVLALNYGISQPSVPMWVVFSVAIVESIGVAIGGVRILKTLGLKIAKVRVDQSLVAQTGAAAVLELASLFAIPISTTQTITSSIIGTNRGVRKNGVRWGLVEEIIISWLITLPATFGVGWLVMSGFLFFGIR